MVREVLLYEETQKLPAIFSTQDLKKIFWVIENSDKIYLKSEWGEFIRLRDRTICATILYLALRPLEACALRFEDFNTQDMSVHIRGDNNKTKKDRKLPIPQKLLDYFKDYFSFPRERFWQGSPFLFPSFENKQNHLSAGRWKHRFRQVLKEANLWMSPINSTVPPYRSYTLRHTRLSEIMTKTHDIFLVANLAGHSKLSSTKVYLHTDENYLEYMREAL